MCCSTVVQHIVDPWIFAILFGCVMRLAVVSLDVWVGSGCVFAAHAARWLLAHAERL